MKQIIILLIALVASLYSQEIDATIMVESGKMPVAVLPFKGTGGTLTENKPWAVIAGDLDFYSKTDVFKFNSVDSSKFAESNVQVYVDGEYSIMGDSIQVTFTLNNIVTEQVLLKKAFIVKKNALRAVSHRFTNLIVDKLFMEKGPFETQVLCTRRSSSGKDIYSMDYDGFNSRKISRGGVNIMPAYANGNNFLWVSYGRGKPDIYLGNLKNGSMKPLIYSRGIEASPDYSPIRGRVVYSSTRSGNSEIYTADISGKNREKLTVSPGIDASPAWSPNGYYVAFISDRSGSPQLYVMDYTGANEKRLTFNGTYHDAPVWSPDGKKIAYTAQREGKFDIFTITLDGKEETRISSVLPGSNQYPVWSPDGSQILFVNSRGKFSNLYRISADGFGEAVPVTKSGDVEMPAWSFIEE